MTETPNASNFVLMIAKLIVGIAFKKDEINSVNSDNYLSLHLQAFIFL